MASKSGKSKAKSSYTDLHAIIDEIARESDTDLQEDVSDCVSSLDSQFEDMFLYGKDAILDCPSDSDWEPPLPSCPSPRGACSFSRTPAVSGSTSTPALPGVTKKRRWGRDTPAIREEEGRWHSVLEEDVAPPHPLFRPKRPLGPKLDMTSKSTEEAISMDFLMGHPQVVGNDTSATLTINMRASQGCVRSPVLYSPFTHEFTDDTTVQAVLVTVPPVPRRHCCGGPTAPLVSSIWGRQGQLFVAWSRIAAVDTKPS
ncbi:uncharacterized protein LOC120065909 [Salvelinus namaycush]|uniref:Uncharacterized protein LOC120065909 n=1 Tax=Salvelinus namaycush TaxID=8040 RepID=A0A8U1H8K0_SALNM|nr:uncharacterized protein LOC120065909 [Salvelinus namaycush]